MKIKEIIGIDISNLISMTPPNDFDKKFGF